MSAAGTERVALLKGATLANLAELLDVLDDQVAGLGELVAQSRVAQIGAGHAIVNPAAGLGVALGNIGVDVLLHVGQEGDDVVARDLLDLVDLCLLKVGMVADPLASSLEMPILPSSAWASQARTSISCQMAYLFSREKMCPISGRV